MKAGYIPDPFGHLSQLPQIRTALHPNAFFMRGVGVEGDDSTPSSGGSAGGTRCWQSPHKEYCNAGIWDTCEKMASSR